MMRVYRSFRTDASLFQAPQHVPQILPPARVANCGGRVILAIAAGRS